MYEISIEDLKKIAESMSSKHVHACNDSYLTYEYSESNYLRLVPLGEILQPYRSHGKIWFRSKDRITEIIQMMLARKNLPPIEVFSKERKKSTHYIVREGFHRYYATLVLGFNFIPIITNDWEFEDS